MRPSRRSLSRRLFLALLTVLAAGGTAVAASAWLLTRQTLQRLLIDDLDHEFDEMRLALSRPDFRLPPQETGVRVWGDPPLPTPPEALRGLSPGWHWRPPGAPHSLARVGDIDARRVYLVMDIDDTLDTLNGLAWLLGGLLLTVLAAAGGAGLWWLRHIARPVEALSRAVAELQPDHRGQRLGSGFHGAEVTRIAAAIDGFLEQLDAFVARERAFTAAASHELRTPLAVLTTTLELLLEDGRLSSEHRARLEAVRHQVERLARRMQHLLHFARGGGVAENLDRIVDRLSDGECELAGVRPQLDRRGPAPSLPAAHAELVIGNLLRNACEHGAAPVRLVRRGGLLIVVDHGPGLDPALRERLGLPGVRHAGSTGSGLGLHLVRLVCAQHGWRFRLFSRPGRGTLACVRFS
ncbi:MAG: two-component sensor histidine kinase [Gammaproteobacteria bacterium]|nr:MAG: two-component sensor histidine kinase [Gammaproteobacteria bacterium]